ETGALARAVLDCAQASPARKDFARRAARRAGADFESEARAKAPRLLLDDAVGVGGALLAAGDVSGSLRVWRWAEDNLSDGPAYADRPAAPPPDDVRLDDAPLDARALRWTRRLAEALPPGEARDAVRRRAEALFLWLAARPQRLDPAVWADVLAAEPR
ncbi:MAG: hypothetical protein KGM24_01315, partial [Elusimicrobia bacterium]|nr:hypothetical protein [Elusimicrobiota bacterium]